MLNSAKDLRKFEISATDGELGTVFDVFFDERSWLVRYVVVDTGNWLPGKRVLIPREALGNPDWKAEKLNVELTRDEIENGPGVESDPPLAQDARLRYYKQYVWTSYSWGGFIADVPAVEPTDPRVKTSSHLRSAREITGYRIEAEDGRIGHVEDFLFTPEEWSIRYVVIDTRNWLPGKKVVVPPTAISRMEWSDETAHVDLSKEQIERAPQLQRSEYSGAVGARLMTIR